MTTFFKRRGGVTKVTPSTSQIGLDRNLDIPTFAKSVFWSAQNPDFGRPKKRDFLGRFGAFFAVLRGVGLRPSKSGKSIEKVKKPLFLNGGGRKVTFWCSKIVHKLHTKN